MNIMSDPRSNLWHTRMLCTVEVVHCKARELAIIFSKGGILAMNSELPR
jgi:hypothetical protein